MKVIHVLSSRKLSGAEKVAIEIIKMFTGEIDMHYCSPRGEIESNLQEQNINYIAIDKVSIKEIRRIVKEYKPDILHAHDYTVSFYCAVSNINIPIISHLHHNSVWISKLNLKSIMYRIALRKIDIVLGVSNAIYQEFIFRKKMNNKFLCINNPINRSEILAKGNEFSTNNKYDLVFVGRLSYEKNPIEFIKIVKDIKAHFLNIKALIVGDGEYSDACNHQIEELGLKDNIDMVGFLNNPYPYIKNSKVLVSTSLWEGYGLVIAEAVILGVPVVANNLGGIKDIINDKCGKLCNKYEEFLEEIEKLLTDNSYYERKSRQAGKRGLAIDNYFQYKEILENVYTIRK